ncbi:venom allergen 3-like [Xylocopa sonorina]|uniref:venom allergen 3-like n=1 Tax=Xylocopa sonorina TaxID=1818115 RepID=UPI00403B1EA0
MYFLYMFVIAAVLVSPSRTINCEKNRCTKRGRQNVLCQYPDPNPASACGAVYSTGMTEQEEKDIVYWTNYARAWVARGFEKRGNPGPQPAASDMRILVWDTELAEIAQRWANQCIFRHAACVDVERFEVGQTVVNFPKPNLAMYEVVELLRNSVTDMDRNQVCRVTDIWKAFSYKIIVWAKTYKMGCGKIVYKMNQAAQNPNQTVVCLYGPGGNNYGERVYEITDE